MMEQSLSLSQKQTLKLNMSMLQSLELMTLPLPQLLEKIEAESLENPTLVAQPREAAGTSYEDYTARQVQAERRGESYSDSSAYGSDLSDSHQAWMENALSEAETLEEHLLVQLGESSCDEGTRQAAAILISNLDERGFNSQSPDEVLPDALKKYKDAALELLHGFDPAGIAVDDFRQSLVVQARALGLDGDDLAVFTSFVYDCLELLKAGKMDEIARRLKVDREDVDALESFLKTLSPYPASAFSSSLERVIVPDVSIKVEEGHLRVRVNDDALPELSIDEGYKEMAGELSKSSRSDEKEASRYLKSQMQAAGNLIRQIELRMSTLERVASVLAVRQKAFFLFGPGNIKPLTLKDVAAEIGVHEATVSRITQGKYVDTDWGIIPMKALFSSAVRTSDGEDSLSKEAVKEMVRKIILDNDTGKPLSDQKISDTLKAKGINCARRTVNKYRKELDIDSSFERSR